MRTHLYENISERRREKEVCTHRKPIVGGFFYRAHELQAILESLALEASRDGARSITTIRADSAFAAVSL